MCTLCYFTNLLLSFGIQHCCLLLLFNKNFLKLENKPQLAPILHKFYESILWRIFIASVLAWLEQVVCLIALSANEGVGACVSNVVV